MAMTFLFERNQKVRIDGATWILRRMVSEDCWQLENVSNGRIIERDRKQLREMWGKRELVPVIDEDREPTKLTTIEVPETAQQIIDLRLAYVRAVEHLPVNKKDYEIAIEEVRKKLSQKATLTLQPCSLYAKKLTKVWHWTTVYRWHARHEASARDSHALLHRKRIRNLNVPARLIEILEDALEEVYFTRERPTLQDALDYAVEKRKEANKERHQQGLDPLPKPSLRMLKRVRSGYSAFDQYAARYGREKAIAKFRSVKGHIITTAPLERAEIDHTPLDLFVVDDETGLPLGRPFLTACIDDYTRCVLGLYVGFVNPSLLSVAQCLMTAFKDKDWIRKTYPRVENVPEIYGFPRVLVVDQALEFHDKSLVQACGRLGIIIEYCPRKRPWKKGKIERFVGTVNREISHRAPGTTFSNIQEKGDYNPENFATVRLSALKEILHMWVYDEYHQRRHCALGVPPAEKWAKSINPDDIPMPVDPDLLQVILGRQVDCVLTEKGVEHKGLFYNSDEMEDLRRRYGFKLKVKKSIDESNIGSLFVIYKDSVFKVPALKSDYAEGISAWQHKKFRENAETSDPDGWMKAKERIRLYFQEECLLKKRRRLRNRGRYREGSSTNVPRSNTDLVSGKLASQVTRPSQVKPDHVARIPVEIPVFVPIIQDRNRNEQSSEVSVSAGGVTGLAQAVDPPITAPQATAISS
jgi:putative transposase